MLRLTCALTLAVLTLSGCGSDSGLEAQVHDLETVFQDQVDVECSCFAELGYTSHGQCAAENYEPLTASEEDCVLEAYAVDEAGSADYLDCLYGVEQLYYQCLQTNLDCADETSVDTCDSDYATNVQMCQLPSAVQQAASACFPS